MASVNYTTIYGDRWDLIAIERYGNIKSVPVLQDANPLVQLSPIIEAGTNLIIPIVDDSDEAIIAENLPPWKR
jgi:phage tail protein X